MLPFKASIYQKLVQKPKLVSEVDVKTAELIICWCTASPCSGMWYSMETFTTCSKDY